MLGAIVALGAPVEFRAHRAGNCLWSCGLLMLCLSALSALTSPEQLWRWVERAENDPPATGRSLGLLVCLDCRATVRGVQAAHLRCPRCHAALHERKPHSLALTAVLVASAAVLYIPANLLLS